MTPRSLKRAAKVFRRFSLSRFADGTRPKNFVPVGHAANAQTIQALHRELITRQIGQWKKLDPVNPGMTLALPRTALAQLCPSYDAKAGTVDLTELLSVLRRNLSGSEFYAAGAPPLIQSAAQSQRQAQVQRIIDSIKQGQPK